MAFGLTSIFPIYINGACVLPFFLDEGRPLQGVEEFVKSKTLLHNPY